MVRSRALVTALAAVLCLVVGSPAEAVTMSSTYPYATAFTCERQMTRLSDGTLAFVFQKGTPVSAGGGLKLAVSHDNGSTWTEVLQVAPLYNVFADVTAGPGRSLYVAYSTNADGDGASKDAQFAKVDYDPGTATWNVVRSSFIVDADTTTGALGAVVVREAGMLWSALRFYQAGNYVMRLYQSLDDGATWSYVMDADTPGPNADETGILVTAGSRLALIYYHQDTQFRCRFRNLGAPATAWSSPQTICQVSPGLESKSGFSAVADNDGQIHLAFGSNGLRHVRTIAGVWQATPTLVAAVGANPALSTNGTDVWCVWQEQAGTDQFGLTMQRYRGQIGTWDPTRTTFHHPSERFADAVWCYSSAAGTWSNVTSGAQSSLKNDVVHAGSGNTFQQAGDALYVGLPVPFSYLYVILGGNGAGGATDWQYWNGSAWSSFVPTSGAYAFTGSDGIRLWPTQGVGPADWSPVAVNGSATLYYVRAVATAPFTTPPLASQVTAFERNRFPAVVANDPIGLTLGWTRGVTGPYPVEMRGTIPWSDIGWSQPLAVGDMGASLALGQNFPNPSQARTTIHFSLARTGAVRLAVYDLRGRAIALLADGVYSSGGHDVVWDGRDRGGAPVASGVYWYRLEANGASATRRMILLQSP